MSQDRERDKEERNWIETAIELHTGLEIGTKAEEIVAKAMGIKRQTVHNWVVRKTMRHVAYERVCQFSRLTRVPCERLTGIDPCPEHEKRTEIN